ESTVSSPVWAPPGSPTWWSRSLPQDGGSRGRPARTPSRDAPVVRTPGPCGRICSAHRLHSLSARRASARARARARPGKRTAGESDHGRKAGPVSLGSLLAASEPSVSPGGEAVVCVGVATLWIAPDRVRPVDEPAIAVPSRPRDWIEEMTPEDREGLSGRALTQLLLGEKENVDEVRGDWARIVALGQPTSRDSRGYPGWLPVDHLSNMQGIHAAGVRVAARHRSREEVEDRTGWWHVVIATATALRDDPDAALAVPGVTFGTRLMALGAPHDGWLPVAVPGRFEPAWAIEDDVAAVPPAPPEDRAEVLE